MMKDNPCSNRNVQTSRLFCILRNINKVIAVLFVDRQESSAFVAEKEGCMSYKWMSIDRLTTLPYLNPTHLYIILCKILPYLLKRDKWLILDLFSRALIAEHIKFLHDLHFLGFLFVADIHNLIDSKGTGTANYIANIVLLPDVVQEQVSSGILLLHFYKTNNHNHNIQHNEISPIAYLIYLFIIIYSVHFLLLSCFFFLLLHFYRF